jgi:hypothetical protein
MNRNIIMNSAVIGEDRMTLDMNTQLVRVATGLLIAGLVVLGLSGCSKDGETQAKVNSSEQQSSVQKQSTDTVKRVHMRAAGPIAEIKNAPDDVPPVHGQRSDQTRKAVAKSLTANEAQEKFEKAMGLLKEHGHDDAVRIRIARIALNDPRPGVRQTAVKMLAECTSPDLLPTLEQALGDKHEGVRLAAIGVLDSMEGIRKARLLEQALDDESQTVRLAAKDAAQRLVDQQKASF